MTNLSNMTPARQSQISCRLVYDRDLRRSDSTVKARWELRLGAPKAIVAMAYHLARLVYRMLRYGEKYVEKGTEYYEQKFRLQRIKWLKKEARSLNLQLVATQ